MKEVYAQRKDASASSDSKNHGLRYTQMIGKRSPDGNESRAYVCLHESEKTGKDDSQERKKGTQKCLLLVKYTLFEPKTEKRFWVLTKSVLSTILAEEPKCSSCF